ncbi:hypothetical protein [Latilactobacillus sakei]|uniref:hypothetical protein n=1 Tax=Latilactobacillus sakei TaxID=1599 RepID=UPI000C1290B4|nr:hypothetical protein [Latilactobacillus sakei]SON72865.1 conserved protein of unknown function [Latilactobacillus sakei]
MRKIQGITITLIDQVEMVRDPLGNPIVEDKPVKVDNVLVAPASADDITNQLNLTGRKAIYTLAIPKGDTHDWENKPVEFFGQRWKVFGIPLEGIDELIPLDWNKKVMVERYE